MKACHLLAVACLLYPTSGLRLNQREGLGVRFVDGLDETQDDAILQIGEQETEAIEQQTSTTSKGGEDDDLELCENVDLGDPIEEYEKDNGGDEQLSDTSKSAPIKKCTTRKKKKPVDSALVSGEALAQVEAAKEKQDFKKMILAEEEKNQQELEKKKAAEKKTQEIIAKQQRKAIEEKKKRAKKDAAQKVKLAEQVKLKAIAEADQAKEEYLKIVKKEKAKADEKKKKEAAKKVSTNSTSKASVKADKIKKRELEDEKTDVEVGQKVKDQLLLLKEKSGGTMMNENGDYMGDFSNQIDSDNVYAQQKDSTGFMSSQTADTLDHMLAEGGY